MERRPIAEQTTNTLASAMRSLLDTLRRRNVPCEHCKQSRAVVVKNGAGSRIRLVCLFCAEYLDSERRFQMALEERRRLRQR
jgi:hypothetical protein